MTHRGRTSGRAYQTPINVFRRGDAYLFFLTYGADVDWVKNVLASGAVLFAPGDTTWRSWIRS